MDDVEMTFCFFGMVLYWALVTKLPRYAAAFQLESSMGVEYNKLTRNFFLLFVLYLLLLCVDCLVNHIVKTTLKCFSGVGVSF